MVVEMGSIRDRFHIGRPKTFRVPAGKHLRANQNAERLHGALSLMDEQSLGTGIPYIHIHTNMNVTFAQFKSMRRNRGKSQGDLQRAWQQHLSSKNGGSNQSRRAATGGSNPNRPQPSVRQAAPCSLEYAAAMMNPFDTPPACLPNEFSQNSMKTKVFTRGSMKIGSNGFGFVAARPMPASDLPNGFATTNAYPGNASSLVSTASVGLPVSNNSPYVSTDFSSDTVSFRVVAFGLRVRWGGTELNRGGKVIMFEEPEHIDLLNGNFSQVIVEGYDRAKSARWAAQGWHSATYQPVQPSEIHYHTDVTSGSAQRYMLAAFFTGIPLETIDYEIVTHLEFIGRSVRGKTPTPYDSAYQLVINRLGQASTILMDRAANLAGGALLTFVRQQFGMPPTQIARLTW